MLNDAEIDRQAIIQLRRAIVNVRKRGKATALNDYILGCVDILDCLRMTISLIYPAMEIGLKQQPPTERNAQ